VNWPARRSAAHRPPRHRLTVEGRRVRGVRHPFLHARPPTCVARSWSTPDTTSRFTYLRPSAGRPDACANSAADLGVQEVVVRWLDGGGVPPPTAWQHQNPGPFPPPPNDISPPQRPVEPRWFKPGVRPHSRANSGAPLRAGPELRPDSATSGEADVRSPLNTGEVPPGPQGVGIGRGRPPLGERFERLYDGLYARGPTAF